MNLPCQIALSLLLGASASPPAPAKRVILISIDGMRGDYLWDEPRYHLKIPNLKALAAAGSFAEAAEGVTPTLTYPSHASIVTGAYPARHGILANARFQPERWRAGEDGYDRQDWYWEASLFRVPTLWQAARAGGLSTAAFSWPSTLGADIDWLYVPAPAGFRPEVKDRRALLLELSTADLIRRATERFGSDGARGDPRLADHYLALMAADALRERKPHLLLIHFGFADGEQHRFGPASPEGLAAIEDVDQNVGILRRAVKDAGLVDETTFIVTGDHGFLPLHTQIAANLPLLEEGLIRLNGEGTIEQWESIVNASRPFAAVYLKSPGLLSRVWAVFERCRDQNPGLFRLLSRTELDQLAADPSAAFALEAETGYTFDDRLSGEFKEPHARRGGHGWTPARAGIETTFLASGRAVLRGKRLPRVRLVDVAPTVARLLGLSLGPTDGRVLTEILAESNQ
jgi:predicted AlkP superfamily pyrophosphatase or phosphodiesterase